MSALLRTRHDTGNGKHFCVICNEPIKLETAKSDEDGNPVHDDCYLKKISGLIPPKIKKNPSATQS
jgi:hypothetical protein